MTVSTFTGVAGTSKSWNYLPQYAEETLPRYTSYPPANRFDSTVGSPQKIAALHGLPADATLSLYLHIPFCQKLCWYCGCHTSVPTRADPVGSYVEALKQEIELVAREAPAWARVTHIHFGGGSPDILAPEQVSDLFASLRRHFNVSPLAEIAAELDPRGVTDDVVQAFADGGLNRASLGVQVLSRHVQERINRIQPAEVIGKAINVLRSAGVEALNIDMMYGLPGQTLEHVVETAMFAALQDADRVAVFGYAHVPWFKKHQKSIRQEDLPAGEMRFRQAEAAARTLQRAGYCAVGFDHFAAPGDSLVAAERQGRLHRNFQGYTDDDAAALIGLGASAISSLPGLLVQNTPDSAAYKAWCAEGRMAAARGTLISAEDRRIGQIIERLLCDFEARIPGDMRIAACARLTPMASAGLIEWCGSHLVVTERGRPYVRNVAASFDPAFGRTAARHSLAV